MKGEIMADSTHLDKLLYKSCMVFLRAGDLSRYFIQGLSLQDDSADTASWDLYSPTFDELYKTLLELQEAIQDPLEGFENVVKPLEAATRVAEEIRNSFDESDGKELEIYRDFIPQLQRIADAGWPVIKDISKQGNFYFGFVNDPYEEVRKSALTIQGRFPVSPEGHVAFIEFVRDEVYNAVEAKRQKLLLKYSDKYLDSMVLGIKWSEARLRMTLLCNPPTGGKVEITPGVFQSILPLLGISLPVEAVNQVEEILQRDLNVRTIEHISDLLTPAVRTLRDELERNYKSPKVETSGIVNTAGDLWKALSEGKAPAVLVSQYSFTPRKGNTPDVTYPHGNDQQKWNTLDNALLFVKREGGEKAAAMEKLLADVALSRGISFDAAINMSLEDFVEALDSTYSRKASSRGKKEYSVIGRQNKQSITDESGATLQKPNRRGRKGADPETIHQEAELAAKWQRARDDDTYKADFAKDHGMTLKEFDKLLDRVAARKKRSDKKH